MKQIKLLPPDPNSPPPQVAGIQDLWGKTSPLLTELCLALLAAARLGLRLYSSSGHSPFPAPSCWNGGRTFFASGESYPVRVGRAQGATSRVSRWWDNGQVGDSHGAGSP